MSLDWDLAAVLSLLLRRLRWERRRQRLGKAPQEIRVSLRRCAIGLSTPGRSTDWQATK